MATIPDEYRDLLDRPITVALATLLPDGQPQVNPVWCDYDGTYIRVNTGVGRQKYKDMLARPQVTILAVDPDDAHRFLEVRGRVAKITEEGAAEQSRKLAHEYTGRDFPPSHGTGETRVICLIEPVRVRGQG